MPRVIPHDHRCPICGITIGCEDKFCTVTELYTVCQKPECQTRYANRTIHLAINFVEDGILPCCGILRSTTPPEDTMTTNQSKVTCKGPKVAGAMLSD